MLSFVSLHSPNNRTHMIHVFRPNPEEQTKSYCIHTSTCLMVIFYHNIVLTIKTSRRILRHISLFCELRITPEAWKCLFGLVLRPTKQGCAKPQIKARWGLPSDTLKP